LSTLRIVEILGRIQQTQQAGLDQIVHVHAGRQPRHEVIGDALHQRSHLVHQFALLRGERRTGRALAALVQFT
jgi:hypothetical protein